MASLFVPTLLGRPAMPTLLGPVPQLLGRFGTANDQESFTPAAPLPRVADNVQPTYRITDAIRQPPMQTPTTVVCACPKQKKWPWLLFGILAGGAVATGVTVAAVGNRETRRRARSDYHY